MGKEYFVGNSVELTLLDRRKVRGKITRISERTRDGRAVYIMWINNDSYFPGDFREKVIVTQSRKEDADDLCLIVSKGETA